MGDMSGEWEEYEDIILDDDSVSAGVFHTVVCRLYHPAYGLRARGALLTDYRACCRLQSLSVLENVDEVGFVLAKIEGPTPPASLARLQSFIPPTHALIYSFTCSRARIVALSPALTTS